jgi:hypothetical protein
MVAWSILCTFIGIAVPVGSAGPTTFTPSVHFSTCNCSSQEIRRGDVRPYLMVWTYHVRLLQQN